MELNSNELVEIAGALRMRCNWIETSNPVLSANDVIARIKKEKTLNLNTLTEAQMKYVASLRELADRLWQHAMENL